MEQIPGYHVAPSAKPGKLCHVAVATCFIREPAENGMLAHLGPYGTRTVPARNTK